MPARAHIPVDEVQPEPAHQRDLPGRRGPVGRALIRVEAIDPIGSHWRIRPVVNLSGKSKAASVPAAGASSPGRSLLALAGGPTAGILVATVILFVVGGVVAPESLGSGAMSG